MHAAHLPTDEWLRLAREQIQKGDGRLAMRALYLATLARLSAEGRLVLAKAKTNLDYERELRRRAPAETQLHTLFAGRRRAFERVWYGRGEPEGEFVRSWLRSLSDGGVT